MRDVVGTLARSVPIGDLIAMIEAKPPVGDDLLFHTYHQLLVSGSAEGVAVGFFAAAGRIGAHRPHLIEALLREPIGALTCIGFESAADVCAYVREVFKPCRLDRIIRNGYSNARRDAGPEGRRWLCEELTGHMALIRQILDEELEQNRADCAAMGETEVGQHPVIGGSS